MKNQEVKHVKRVWKIKKYCTEFHINNYVNNHDKNTATTTTAPQNIMLNVVYLPINYTICIPSSRRTEAIVYLQVKFKHLLNL